jgi:hypothetical protein
MDGQAPVPAHRDYMDNLDAIAFRNVGADTGVCPYALRKSVPAWMPFRIAPAGALKKVGLPGSR